MAQNKPNDIHTIIRVTLINDADQSIMDVSDVPLEQLPEQFELEATLSLGTTHWQVKAASPMQASEFKRTGELTLNLLQVEHISPQNILFTLPTISNELPEMAPSSPFQGSFEWELMEDDWRQYEFLNPSSREIIDQELESISTIWSDHRKDSQGGAIDNESGFYAFSRLHVRKTIGEPHLAVNFDALQATLCQLIGTEALQVGALKIHPTAGCVKNGFAINTPVAIFYGTLDTNSTHGIVTLLGISPKDDEANKAQQTPDIASIIETITSTYDLIFVNWCGCEVIPA